MTSSSRVCSSGRASFPTTSTKHCITSGWIVSLSLPVFTRFRPYLAHFSPVVSRFLRVFTAWPRRFQRRCPGRGRDPVETAGMYDGEEGIMHRPSYVCHAVAAATTAASATAATVTETAASGGKERVISSIFFCASLASGVQPVIRESYRQSYTPHRGSKQRPLLQRQRALGMQQPAGAGLAVDPVAPVGNHAWYVCGQRNH